MKRGTAGEPEIHGALYRKLARVGALSRISSSASNSLSDAARHMETDIRVRLAESDLSADDRVKLMGELTTLHGVQGSLRGV